MGNIPILMRLKKNAGQEYCYGSSYIFAEGIFGQILKENDDHHAYLKSGFIVG